MYLRMDVVLYNAKIEILYQIIDRKIVIMKDTPLNDITESNIWQYLIWKYKFYVTVVRLKSSVFKRITVKLKHPCGIHVHDGPGKLSEQLNHNNLVIHFSLFQAYILMYTQGWLFNFGIDRIDWSTKNIKPIQLYVNHSKQIELSSCLLTLNYRLRKRKLNSVYNGNQHCVYNITSQKVLLTCQ